MRRLRWLVSVVAALVCGLILSITVAAGEGPLAVSPGSGVGTVVASACPTFSWGAVAGAESYDLVTYQVPEGLASAASPDNLKELWQVTLPGSARSWTPPEDQCFTHGGSYAWSVRAVVAGTPGAWSEANLFSVEKAPSAEEVRGTIAGLRRYLAQAEERGQRVASPSNASASSRRGFAARRQASGKRHGSKATLQKEKQKALRKLALREKALRDLGGKESNFPMRSVSQAAPTPTLGTPSLSVDANIALGASSNVFKDGRVFLWNDALENLALGDSALASADGSAAENTAVGFQALRYNTSGSWNTAAGQWALYTNSTGENNTAIGQAALRENTTGSDNTATGTYALLNNTTGYYNTASGYAALRKNTTGWDNTASGFQALYSNTTGSRNTAVGYKALTKNSVLASTSGRENTAIGYKALFSNTGGYDNTAVGDLALFNNSSFSSGNYQYLGSQNTAIGYAALLSNTGGQNNVAVGPLALYSNTTGSENIAIGFIAGRNAGYGGATDNHNIFIGSEGLASDNKVIKIGTEGVQTSAYIAGVRGETTGQNNAVTVLVDSNGQLGTASSSRRVKQDIEDMGDVTDKLYELRPVSFRYKKYVREAIAQGKDPKTLPRSYGLIAEEVAKVFPDLVVYGEDGKPETIKYRLLAPMLLNELQKEHWRVIEQGDELTALKREDSTQQRALEAEVEALESDLSRLETRLAARAPQAPKGAGRTQGTVASKLQR